MVPIVLAAPDKFRGTASAREIASAVERAAAGLGWACDQAPMADGGEGLLDVLPGRLRRTAVSGPLGEVIEAEWRLDGSVAVIEMARASGLELVGGPDHNRATEASSTGTGQLIAAAVAAGASRVIVGLGGSATTDGGLGCLDALRPLARLRGVELVVACDVSTRFVDAAETYAPQKGASPAEVALLRRRLERLAQVYLDEHGVDVTAIAGGGAAGGLAGALAAVGAQLVSGFELVADAVDLPERVEAADLVVTGEGFLDEQSFEGKVVGGVVDLARAASRPMLVVVGEVVDEGPVERVEQCGGSVVSLVERFGRDAALADPVGGVAAVVTEHLRAM